MLPAWQSLSIKGGALVWLSVGCRRKAGHRWPHTTTIIIILSSSPSSSSSAAYHRHHHHHITQNHQTHNNARLRTQLNTKHNIVIGIKGQQHKRQKLILANSHKVRKDAWREKHNGLKPTLQSISYWTSLIRYPRCISWETMFYDAIRYKMLRFEYV